MARLLKDNKLKKSRNKRRVLYKVVNSESRKSVVAATVILGGIRWGRTFREVATEFRKYLLTYSKGRVIKARKNTLGCFLFKRKRDAVKFADGFPRTRILRCMPMAKCKKPRIVCLNIESDTLDLFYSFHRRPCCDYGLYHSMKTYHIPVGTTCCQKVKVLD